MPNSFVTFRKANYLYKLTFKHILTQQKGLIKKKINILTTVNPYENPNAGTRAWLSG